MDDVDFDSGDELFNGIDSQDLLPSQKRHTTQDERDDASSATKRQRCDASHAALARRILTDKFGHRSFNHQQEAAINRILAGQNTLVVFPTGAGKSLCYQVMSRLIVAAVTPSPNQSPHKIPAIAFEELDATDGSRAPGQSGISIVVSPLIALMKDQVDALQNRGIPVASMNSSKTYEQQQLTRVALQKGQIRLLYCAPERLNNETFIENMKTVPGGVRLVAVDEAHCISEV